MTEASGITEITKAIGDVGIMIVISAVVIYAIIRGLKLLFGWLEDRTGQKKHDEALEVRNIVNSAIQDDIYAYLESHEVHRVQVIEFSNSVTSVTYLPFKYASCTYEAFDIDQQGRSYNIDKLNTSLFTPFLRILYTVPYIELDEDNPDIKQYGGTAYDLLRRCKEHRGIYVMIKSNNNKSVGYVSAYKDEEFTPDDIADLEAMAIRLSAQLCVLDNSKESR